MKLSRALALSAAVAATCASATATDATASNDDSSGLLSFLSNELQRSSSLVQRLFYGADEPTAPDAVQLIIIEDESADVLSNVLIPSRQELTRQEQQRACETALQIFREKDALHEDRQRLSQRLRSPFKRAFQAMSLHYFDEASCDDLDDSRLVDGCNRFVDMEDAVRQFMTRGRANDQVCARVIAHMDAESPVSPNAMEGELSCKLCKRFVQMIDDALAQEVSQVQVVREIIGDICDSMAPDSRCHAFLDQYDQIVAWLKQGTSPDVVCTRATMCPTPQALSVPIVSDAVVSASASASALANASDNGHACGYCAHITYVVIKVNAVSPEHLNFARKLIEWGCKLSPRSCKCDVLAANYDKIVAWVKQGKSSREICEALKVCTKASTAQVFALGEPDRSVGDALSALMPLVHVADSAADAAVQNTKTCFYCDYATTLIQIAMQEQGDVIDEVRMYADLICNLLGPDNVCHRYVDKLDTVIDKLKEGKRPREICAAMMYCAAKRNGVLDAATQTLDVAPFAPSGALARDDKTCMYCDYGALVLKIIMQQDAAQVDEIRQAADMVCGFMGPDNVCHQYVDKLDVMIDQLKQGKSPRVICVALKYCSAASKALPAPVESAMDAFVAQSQAVDVRDDKKCFYCDYVATLLQIVMQEDASQVDELREYADMICGILGPDNVCHQYVDKLDIVIDQLKKGQHPRQICVSLKYCSAKPATASAPELSDLAAITRTHTSDAVVSASASASALANASDNGHACGYCAHITYVVIKVNAVSPEHLNFARKLIEWGCKLSPRSCKCDVLAANYDKIVAWVKQGKSSREICEALKVCTKASTAQVFALGEPDRSVGDALSALMPLVHVADSAADAAVQNTKTCFYCDYATTLIQIAMQEQGDVIDEVRMYADLICNLLGPDNVCHRYVDKLDTVIDKLKEGKRPREICAAMMYCAAKRNGVLDAATQTLDVAPFAPSGALARDDKTCMYCDYGALVLKIIMQQDAAQVDEIRQAADMVCGFMGPDNVCHQYVDKLDVMIDQLKQGKSPRVICVALKYCSAASKALPAPVESAMDAFVAQSQAVDVRDDKKCFYCDYVATLLQIVMQEDASQVDELREYADMICGILGPDNVCHQYVDKLDIVIDQLKKGQHPRQICVSLKYCAAKSSVKALPSRERMDLSAFDQTLVKVVTNSVESAIDSCFMCTQLASILEVALQEDPSQIEQIRQIGDMVCHMLPSDSKCRPVMDELDTVIDSLKKGETPKAICHDLKFCKASRANAIASPPPAAAPRSANTSCAYCSGVVTVLEVALKQKPAEVKEAREAAGIVCGLLPSDDKCHDDLKLFDAAVAQLKSGKQPHEICTSLKFCDSEDAATAVTLADLAVVDPSLSPSRCTICKQNSLLLASMVGKPTRLAAFHHEMNAICRLIPDTKECELLLKHHDTIVDALTRDEDVASICTRIRECGAATEPAQPVETASFSVSCLLCEYTAEMVKHAAKNQNELRLAKVALETMCTILPPTARCDEIASKFDELVEMAQHGTSPSDACRAIALCGAAATAAEPAVATRADYLLPAAFVPMAPIGNIAEVE